MIWDRREIFHQVSEWIWYRYDIARWHREDKGGGKGGGKKREWMVYREEQWVLWEEVREV